MINKETEYLKYFNARANKLVADRQLAESKVTVFKDEVRTFSLKCIYYNYFFFLIVKNFYLHTV